MRELKIDVYRFSENLAEALNDTGLGSLEGAPWFVEELFYRLKKYYRGYENTFDIVEIETKEMLDYQSSTQTTIKEGS